MKQSLLVTIFTLLSLYCFAQKPQWHAMIDDPNYSFFEVQEAFNKAWEGKEYEPGKGYKQFKRYEYFMEGRVDEKGFYDPTKAEREFNEYLKIHQAQETERAMSNWSLVGPTSPPSTSNAGGIGRIDCIAFHPTNNNTYWAGSPSGGLWKTTNDGASWSTNTDFLSGLGISDIAIDPTNTNIMYVGTGDRDHSATSTLGVLKSTNGGASWAVSGLAGEREIYRLLLNPNNPNILLAATYYGVFRSTDAGATWNNVASVPSSLIYYMEYHPTNPNIVYASSWITNNYQFFKSTDGGATFTAQTLPFAPTDIKRAAIGVSANAPNNVYLYCTDPSTSGLQGIYKSTNSGASFTLITPPTATVTYVDGTAYSNDLGTMLGDQGWYDWMFAVNPNDENEMIVGAVSMARTFDGGATWQALSTTALGGGGIHVDFHKATYHPNTGVAFVGCDGGVWRQNGPSGYWDPLNDGLITTQNYTFSTCLTDPNLMLVGNQDNNTWYMNGTNWSHATGGDGMGCWIDPGVPTTMYSSSQRGNIYKTSNGFSSYSTICTPTITGQSSTWVTKFDMHPIWRNKLYAAYEDVWFSDDAGGTWSAISSFGSTGTLSVLEISPSNPDYIYTAGSGSGFYRTTDGGASWTTLTIPSGAGWVNDVAIHATNPDIIWVRFLYTVYKSTDGGGTWTDVTGSLPNIYGKPIVYQADSNDGVYVGLDKGIYYRDNTMSDWVLFNTALPNVVIEDLEINYCSGIIRAATYGRATWESDLYSFNAATACCPLQSPSISPNGLVNVCGVPSATLTADAAPAGYGYQWYVNESPIPGATAQTYTVTTGGDYVVLFSHPTCPSYHSDPVEVIISNSSLCQYTSCEILNTNSAAGSGNPTVIDVLGPFPIAGGTVNICVTQEGDNSNGSEIMNVYDENNVLQGQTTFASDCSGPSPVFCFSASANDFNSWALDNMISITFDPVSTAINPTLCGNNEVCAIIDLPISSSACAPILYVPTGIPTGTYAASINVNSDGLVNAGANVTFEAGTDIDLNPNFEVMLNTDFLAHIVACFASGPVVAFGSNPDDKIIELSKVEIEEEHSVTYDVDWSDKPRIEIAFQNDNNQPIKEMYLKNINGEKVGFFIAKNNGYEAELISGKPGIYMLVAEYEDDVKVHKIILDKN